ncbi:MAG: phosphotransferase [Patescibacteria group bacterium]
MDKYESRIRDLIESRYAVGHLVRCQNYPIGFINNTYKLETADGQYALTEFLHKSSREVAIRAEVLLGLRNLPVAPPVASLTGEHVVEFDGHPAWICPWLEGASPQNQEDGSGNMSHMQRQEAVYYFKELHRQLQVVLDESEDLNVESFVTQKLPEDGELKTTDTVQKLIDECRECCRGVLLSTEETELVHKDFERQNLLYGETRRLIGILDFDSLRAGYTLYEWAHIMFNHVCDDANPSAEELSYYIESSPFSEMSDARARLLALMAQFCEDDIKGFAWIAQHQRIALPAIADRYRHAFAFAKKELQGI